MEKDHIIFQITPCLNVLPIKIKLLDVEELFMQMEIIMMDKFFKIKRMDMGDMYRESLFIKDT